MEVMMMMPSSYDNTTLSPSPLHHHHHHHHHDNTRSRSSSPSAASPPSPPAPKQQQVVAVVSPCAACKILRRRCSAEKCVLAPYFPPTDPLKFATAHRVFGASNIIKLLQELPESQRSDAVSSMVYEANARVRDPVYGTAGAICHLQKQVGQLQGELAKAQAEVMALKSQQSHLLAMLCMNLTTSQPPVSSSRVGSGLVSSTHNPPNNTIYYNTPSTPIISTDTTTTSIDLPYLIPDSPVHEQDYSELDSPMSDGFLNFYPDATNCSLISWELL